MSKHPATLKAAWARIKRPSQVTLKRIGQPEHETTADFKARLAAMDKSKRVKKPPIYREKGNAPTPSEVLGGAKMPKLSKPPKAIAKWLRSIGVKV